MVVNGEFSDRFGYSLAWPSRTIVLTFSLCIILIYPSSVSQVGPVAAAATGFSLLGLLHRTQVQSHLPIFEL